MLNERNLYIRQGSWTSDISREAFESFRKKFQDKGISLEIVLLMNGLGQFTANFWYDIGILIVS